MRLPGFTAEAATYVQRGFFHEQALDENRSFAGLVTTMYVRTGTCPPGSAYSGCPRGTWCAEPGGDWPFCRCLQCTSIGR
jgi:hypothetical protein